MCIGLYRKPVRERTRAGTRVMPKIVFVRNEPSPAPPLLRHCHAPFALRHFESLGRAINLTPLKKRHSNLRSGDFGGRNRKKVAVQDDQIR